MYLLLTSVIILEPSVLPCIYVVHHDLESVIDVERLILVYHHHDEDDDSYWFYSNSNNHCCWFST